MDWKKETTALIAKLESIPGYSKLGADEVKAEVEKFVQDSMQILHAIAEKPELADAFKPDFDILKLRLQGIQQLAIAKTENYIINLVLDAVPDSVLPSVIKDRLRK